ncbi:MAG: SIS domain-containing protein [Anaerolineales bacterium]|nr:SIS domain-containing protein [Anaerolineales bacterium]
MSLKSEIFEQPAVLEQLLAHQSDQVERIAAEIRRIAPAYVFLAARGTSDNAGRYANYLWGSHNGLPVALATPSLFTYYAAPPKLQGALVVGVSQSGQSPDIVSVLAEGRRQGCPTLAITNAPASPLAQAADFVIDIQAGIEAAVAATKTYTAELMAIAMLSAALLGDPVKQASLAQIPAWARQALELDERIQRSAERYRYMSHCVVIGRGYNYATAFEWSLKMKELSYVVAEPYSSADFQHGPIAMVDRGFPVMAVAPGGKVYRDVLGMLRQLRRVHQAELLIISDQAEALEQAQSPLPLPADIPEWLTPLAAIIPAQLFAYHLTRVKGYDTESPRTIHKVTETH